MHASFENTRLIFKFSDNVNLSMYNSLFQRLVVPEGYESELKEFIWKSQNKTTSFSKYTISRFSLLLEDIEKKIGSQPTYLFRYSSIQAFNQLRSSLDDARARRKNISKFSKANAEYYTMPVFYLCFEFRIPETFDQAIGKELMERFAEFLPKTGKEGESPDSLLEYAYLKADAIEADVQSIFSIQNVMDRPDLKGNQNYLRDMNIDTRRIASLAGKNVWMGIVEKKGWYLGHSEFGDLSDRWTLLLDPNSPSNDSLRGDLTAGLNNDHGTKVLGVLISQQNDTVPDCKGLLPSGTKLAFSSQTTELQAIDRAYANNAIKTHVGDEENAFTRILDFYSANHYLNQTILVELFTPSPNFLPMTSEPLFASLVENAYHLGHTVIIPAGNYPADVSLSIRLSSLNSTSSTSGLLSVRDFTQNSIRYILVGGAETNSRLFKVHSFSNWDEKLVHLFAQAHNILTTNRRDHDYNTTRNTSGASAIIAGVVGLLQAYALNSYLNRALFPEEMIQILADSANSSGKLVKKGSSVVGHIPNVKEAMRLIGNLP